MKVGIFYQASARSDCLSQHYGWASSCDSPGRFAHGFNHQLVFQLFSTLVWDGVDASFSIGSTPFLVAGMGVYYINLSFQSHWAEL